MKLTPIMKSLALAGIISTLPVTSWAETSPKEAAAATKQANDALYKQLPFSDNTDFTNAHKGFIAALPTEVIKGEQGNVIWNPQQYDFIKEGEKAPDTVNPSLWRQSQLINISGLFEVTEGVYQIRNLDLSNMTIIEGKEGITVVDPLVSAETAKVGMDLYYKNRGNKPVVAVIYTHSHVDHYGGVRGVVDEADVKSGKVKIYAPSGFMEAAVAENIMAGNVMSRRASYMYGNLLKPDATGQVGAGLGTTTSAGTVTLIAPTNIIEKDGQKETIDGLTYDFMLAPGSEAPSEMLWYIEEKKLIESAEDVTHTLHNTYSLRGAKIREPLPWSKYINAAIVRWGDKAEIIMAQHHWPTWGNENVVNLLKSQRDLYRYINDQTLRMANEGLTRDEIAAKFKLGYQAESGPWRNFYLTGAQELRNGVVKGPTPNTASPDTVRAMTPEMFFDYLAVHINGEKAGTAKAVFNIDLGNDGGKYKLELENGVLNHTADAEAKDADATIALDRATLNKIILKEETLKQAEDKGEVKVTGDGAKLDEMLGYMDKFEFWFNIVTP